MWELRPTYNELESQLGEARGDIGRLEGEAEDLAEAQDDAQSANARADALEAQLKDVVSGATALLESVSNLGQEAQRWANANRSAP